MLNETLLTRAEAFEYLATLWDHPISFAHETMVVVILPGYGYCMGICHCIEDLCSSGKITVETKKSMEAAIKEKGKPFDSVYLWPRSLEGARARAEFCREEAKRC